jgi:hypothetical protein
VGQTATQAHQQNGCYAGYTRDSAERRGSGHQAMRTSSSEQRIKTTPPKPSRGRRKPKDI